MNPTKSIGIVKWFNNAKGYGFILNEQNEDVMVHHRSIVVEGYKTLATGQTVKFIQTKSTKGWQAVETVLIDADDHS